MIKLKTPRKIVEASGSELDIIGSCEIFCKLSVINSVKRLQCLVLRGNHVDREILVSCQTLKNWDLIHPTFGRETITNYMNRCKSNLTRHRMTNKIKHVSQLYYKSQVSTDDLLSKVPKDCVNLRDKILKNHHDVFKEKLGPEDPVN